MVEILESVFSLFGVLRLRKFRTVRSQDSQSVILNLEEVRRLGLRASITSFLNT